MERLDGWPEHAMDVMARSWLGHHPLTNRPTHIHTHTHTHMRAIAGLLAPLMTHADSLESARYSISHPV